MKMVVPMSRSDLMSFVFLKETSRRTVISTGDGHVRSLHTLSTHEINVVEKVLYIIHPTV